MNPLIVTDPAVLKMDLFEFVRWALTCPNSFVGGGEAQPIPGKPEWEGFRIEVPGRSWVFTDEYFVNCNGMSGGQHCMWSGGDMKLWVWYHGFYHKEVEPFLRRCLLTGLQQGRYFQGFRGPPQVDSDDGKYRYINEMPRMLTEPALFQCNEGIYAVDKQGVGTTRLGYHVVAGSVYQ